MAAPLNLALGAPGIYRYPEARLRELRGVRMDVCAFLGVAPRGPAREDVLDTITRSAEFDPRATRKTRRTVPVSIESFDDYRRCFGGFEGPGLLPYAVAAFFENGGQRAYVARIVHQYDTDLDNQKRTAWATLGGAVTAVGFVRVRARSEGSWGNHLRSSLTFRYSPLNTTSFALASVRFPDGEPLELGSMLRLTLANGMQVFREVTVLTRDPASASGPGAWTATLQTATPSVPVGAELVVADLTIDDLDDSTRSESYSGLGLSSAHSQWLGAALAYDSRLVYPDRSWVTNATIEPRDDIPGAPFSGGEDGFEAITPSDFFDFSWSIGDEEPGDGVASLVDLEDVSLVVAPDLYSPGPLVAAAPPELPAPASPFFERCAAPATASVGPVQIEPDLTGLRLDPATDLAEIERWQSALVEFAAQQGSFIVLLDVPPRISPRQILQWRTRFNSAYAAAYHPWLKVARTDDLRDALIEEPPAAAAAGIIAQREIAVGIAHGPANVLAAGAVDVTEVVPPPIHDELHPLGINVYLRERDGIRLTAARTLSRDPTWRQLSVRRLLTLIRRVVERQMQWAVFEPNDARLRLEVRRLLMAFLRRLFQGGAFRGATEEESFFVRCDEALNPSPVVDAGQLITHIGVAPSEPLEFIVIRLLREGDGTLLLED